MVRNRREGWKLTCSGLVAVAALVVVPACSSSGPTAPGTTTTAASTTPSVTVPHQNPAEIAACTADAKSVEVALDAYQAVHGSFPVPPSPWSAATYAANFGPLTTSGGGGPFMPTPPKTTSYVIAYDAAGHVWVAPPGAYGPYNKGQDIDLSPDICDAAVG